jgi:hypothetical protein
MAIDRQNKNNKIKNKKRENSGMQNELGWEVSVQI